jgi:(p)ppGpp synthase/HD superfamily hydrolase
MASSVVKTARSFGVPPADLPLLQRAHAMAMEPRVAALDDDHHPLYLHPGRTMLVLMRDAGVTDPVLLAAAAVTESEDEAFRIPVSRVRAELGDGVADLVIRVPKPGSERLAEDLVAADERLRLVALAERLDHVRHAHLRDTDDAWRRAAHAEAQAVYLPVAERTHPRLAQRYRHWCRAYGRKLG